MGNSCASGMNKVRGRRRKEKLFLLHQRSVETLFFLLSQREANEIKFYIEKEKLL